MEGVTTALVFATLLGLMFPGYVRNKPQFYGAFAFVLVIILLDSVARFAFGTGLAAALYAVCGLLQIAALILVAMSVSGRSIGELGADMAGALDDVRAGRVQRSEPESPARKPVVPAAEIEPDSGEIPTPAPRTPGDNKSPLPFD